MRRSRSAPSSSQAADGRDPLGSAPACPAPHGGAAAQPGGAAARLDVPAWAGLEPGSVTREALRRTGRLRPRLLVIGNFGAGNTGDDAILAGLADSLRHDADITVASRRPAVIERMHGLPAVSMTSWRGLVALLRSDVVAVGGGGIFGQGLPPMVALLPAVLLLAHALGRKRIVLQALGVYPDTPRPTLALLRAVARVADGISLRDEISVTTMAAGPGRHRCQPRLVADPSFYMHVPPAEVARAALAAHGVAPGQRPLMVSVKPTPDLDLNARTIDTLAEMVSWWLDRQDAPVVIIPMSGQGDYGLGPDHSDTRLGDRLRRRCSQRERVLILPDQLEPRLAKAMVGEAAALVGMRLHALLFAVGMYRPVLGVVFEHKARSMMTQLGADQLAVEGLSTDQLTGWLARVTGVGAGAAAPEIRRAADLAGVGARV